MVPPVQGNPRSKTPSSFRERHPSFRPIAAHHHDPEYAVVDFPAAEIDSETEAHFWDLIAVAPSNKEIGQRALEEVDYRADLVDDPNAHERNESLER